MHARLIVAISTIEREFSFQVLRGRWQDALQCLLYVRLIFFIWLCFRTAFNKFRAAMNVFVESEEIEKSFKKQVMQWTAEAISKLEIPVDEKIKDPSL